MDVDYYQYRLKMVDGQLRTTDVTVPELLDVMGVVPRERFVDPSRKDLAYIDEDVVVAQRHGGAPLRYLMEASPFAKLVQLAEVGSGDAVLDIGCATGYSSAVLSRLARTVVALESNSDLAARATATLVDLGYGNVSVVVGALAAGFAPGGPYDVIILGGAVEALPATLFDQLREGGRLVAVEGLGNAGRAKRYLKSVGATTGRHAFNAAVKPLPGFERTRTFEF